MRNILMVGLLSVASSGHATEVLIDFDDLDQSLVSDLTIQNVNFSMFETDSFVAETFDYWGNVLDTDEFSNGILVFEGTNALTFTFDNAVSAFSFNMLPSNSLMTWELNGFDESNTLVESVSLAENVRFGELVSGIDDISYAVLTKTYEPSTGSSKTSLILDNFRYTEVSPVPEPSTYALMLGGLGLVGFMAYRRKKVLS